MPLYIVAVNGEREQGILACSMQRGWDKGSRVRDVFKLLIVHRTVTMTKN